MTFSRVQNASDGDITAALTITLSSAPTNGNLLVAWANSDATVTIGGSGWTAGPFIIDGNGAYFWWKVAGSSEPSSVVFTPSINDYICAGLIEYSGNTATPFDVSGSFFNSAFPVNSTGPISVTTTSDHDLVVSAALLHHAVQAAPTSPVWTGGLGNVQSQGALPGSPCRNYTFYGDNLDAGTAGSISVGVSWSGTAWADAQQLLMTFKAAATPPPPSPASPSALVFRRKTPVAVRRGRMVRIAGAPGSIIRPYSGPFGFMVQVLLAFDGPTAASPNWIDVTGYVDTRAMIRITHGRADGLADVNASTCALTVDNSDGRWCASNPNGAWFGLIHKGCWLRIVVTPPSGISTDRFVGFITQLPTVWSGQYASSQITASDRFEKLGFAKSLISSIEHEVLSDPNLAGSIKGYWNLHEDQNARTFGDTSGANAPAMVAASYGGVPVGTGFAANAVAGPGFDGLRAVSFNPPGLNQGTYLGTAIASPTGSFDLGTGAYTGLYPTLELWFQSPISISPTNYQVIASFLDAGADFACNVILQNHKVVIVPVGTTNANAANYFMDFYPYPQPIDDGAWHHLIVGCAATNDGGGWVSMVAIVDGVWIRASVQNGGAAGTTGGNFTKLIVGGGWGGNTADVVYFGQVNLAEVAWYWSDLMNASTIAGRPPDHLSHYNAGATGFSGEATDRRIARIARYAGIPQAYALSQDAFNAGPPLGPGSTSPATLGQVQSYRPVKTAWVNLAGGSHYCGTQSISGRKALDVLREAGRTEGMPLYVDRSGYLAQQPSTTRQNTAPAWSVDSRDLEKDTSMPDDYAYTTNQMTITPNGQAAQLVIGPVGAASQLKHGERDGSQATANINPTEAQSLGLSIIVLRADPPPRLAPIVVEAATLAGQAGYGTAWYDAVLATEISTPMRVTNLPPQAGGGNQDALVEGWTETILSGQHLFAFNTSPIQGPTYQLDDGVLGRADTDGSTLAAAAGVADTSITVATAGQPTGSPLWVTDGLQFPLDVGVDAEQITVTSISTQLGTSDGTFETGVTGWTTSSCTFAQVSSPVYAGTKAGLMTVTGSPTTATVTSDFLAATQNTPYIIAAQLARSALSPQVQLAIFWYNSGHGLIGTSTGASFPLTGTAFGLATLGATSPASTAYLAVVVELVSSPATGTAIVVDNVTAQPIAGPQVFQVIRSVNGVVASHSSGAAVALWTPLTLAY